MDEHGGARAIKRAGGRPILSLDELLSEAEAATLAIAYLDDLSGYDLTWASNVAKQAWAHLHEALAAEGNAQWLNELRPFVAGGSTTPPNQEEVGSRLGVPVATLRTLLSRLHQRYRKSLRMEVASTDSHPADVDDEMRYLHRTLTS
jgi:hypothetical protein